MARRLGREASQPDVRLGDVPAGYAARPRSGRICVKIYTKRGDDGTTGLFHGGRVDKDDPRTEAYGTVDEACSALGVARAELDGHLHDQVLTIQRELFVLGAQLATAADRWDRLEVGVSRVDDAMVDAIDTRIDAAVER